MVLVQTIYRLLKTIIQRQWAWN